MQCNFFNSTIIIFMKTSMKTNKHPLLEEGDAENLVAADSYADEDGKEEETEEVQNKPTKKAKIERDWSEEEEIAVLNAGVKFSDQRTALDPAVNKAEFFAFTREGSSQPLLHDFSRTEIATKVRRLKKKFFDNVRKGKSVSSAHETRVFELSLGIWGATVPPKSDSSSGKNEFVNKLLKENHIGMGQSIVEEAMKQIGEAKRNEFVEQWKEVQVMELELSLKKAELVEFVINAILGSHKSSSSS